LQVAGKFEPAVGHQIAGGEKKAGGHFRNQNPSLPGGGPDLDRGRPGNPSQQQTLQKMDARVKPAYDDQTSHG
jgi:hypothetical protein